MADYIDLYICRQTALNEQFPWHGVAASTHSVPTYTPGSVFIHGEGLLKASKETSLARDNPAFFNVKWVVYPYILSYTAAPVGQTTYLML